MTKTAIKYTGRPEHLNNSKTVELLKGFLKKRSDILLAFLFGSFASKQMTLYSDIDIALLFDQAPDIYGINNLKDELTLLLKKETDIAVLNEASPILKMQVLKNGVLIFKKDKKYFNQFCAETINQYDDLKQIRKKCEDGILKGRIYA